LGALFSGYRIRGAAGEPITEAADRGSSARLQGGLWRRGVQMRRGFPESSKRRGSVSCLIADVQMPGMSGFELHGRLATSGTPVPRILVTAYPDERARERALQSGVICYLAKPFSDDELLACIRSGLGCGP
jgi:CheY-like chemotaxis protein